MARERVQKRRKYKAPSYSSSDGEENVTGDVPPSTSQATRVAKSSKRPMTSFVRFQIDFIKEQKSEYGDKHYKYKIKEASKRWNQMTDKEKEPYKSATLEEMEIYAQYSTRNSKKKEVFNNKSSLSKFIKVVSQFDEKKRKAVQQIGFGNLLELKCSHLNRDLCLHLISRFDCSSRRLRVGDGKSIPISTLDIESILGIPRTQLPVPTGIHSGASWIEDGGFSKKEGLRTVTLANKLLKLDAGDEFKRAFVLFTCRTILSPNCRYEVYLKLLKAVDRVEQIRTYNWCLYYFKFMLKSIKNSSGLRKSCNGCLIFLQLFYLMRVDVKGPTPKEDAQSIGVWTDELINARIRFEKEEIGGFGRCQDSFNCTTQYSPMPFYLTRHANVEPEMNILSPATRDNPVSEKFTSELALETQVSSSPAASLMCPSQLEKTTSTGTPRLVKRRKAIDNISNSISKSNTSNDETDLENSITKVNVSQAQEDEEIEPAAALSASDKVVSDNHQPIREASEASNIVGSRPEGSAKNGNQREEHLGRTSSLNLTGMADMLDDDSFDVFEVGSSLDSALVRVNGYRVKPEWALLLNAIFLKHGDIAKYCSLLSITSRSSLLEIICDIVQTLQDSEFTRITPVDIKSMLDRVRDMETVKMEVGWLHQRLDDIFEAMCLFKGYSTLKEAHRRKVQIIDKREEELKSFKMEILALEEKIVALKEKVLLAEDELTPMKAEAEKIDETVLETKAKVKCFYQKSLVHGLL